jgi:uncharacterized protein DUF6600
MNNTKHLVALIGFVLCGGLPGYTTYAQPSVAVEVSVPLPSVEIRAESDFYQPLTPYGEWVVIGSYGRCWRPGRVETGWRPYCNGNWQRTEAGWYWVSDEPWAWATYHYGRWDLSAEFGWYWVPQTQWAPAWVSWHSGGGYIGWAPSYPSSRFGGGGALEVDVRVISPRAYVFVDQRHFLEPVRPSTVVVNNTTILNKTVNITNTKIVNNTVINEGPAPAIIEKASGRKVQSVAVSQLRHKQEAAQSELYKPVPAATHAYVAPTTKSAAAQNMIHKPARPAPEFEPEIKAPSTHPAAINALNGQKNDNQPGAQGKSAKPSDKKMQPPAQEKSVASEKNRPSAAGKDPERKVKD